MNQPTDSKTTASAVAGTSSSTADGIRTLDSQELLGKQGVLYIRHQGETYRLQTTRFGKLILTK
ncbi:hemin uptake protein HemP [Limnohabitans sp. TS-CS-82]|jgi:hemin uptake protein HemP|uniref:hemin uptake protein HemP n=1 Tax=Limnohabitans sp. TS-CS-82 TaxID=2094193 RepID=UPI000CF27B67|nr:hemin uptake protein HemP [Limnohabitans sp. TS-CS-82]PQA85112.1 hemin uptake protein HemP [Limnohabitans sp. TS-CS-82]